MKNAEAKCHQLEVVQRLYDRFGKPMEVSHLGRYIGISAQGQTVLGESALEVLQLAKLTFREEVFIFRVGERALGWLRQPLDEIQCST